MYPFPHMIHDIPIAVPSLECEQGRFDQAHKGAASGNTREQHLRNMSWL